jgi:hypothetical protein
VLKDPNPELDMLDGRRDLQIQGLLKLFGLLKQLRALAGFLGCHAIFPPPSDCPSLGRMTACMQIARQCQRPHRPRRKSFIS